MSLTAVQYKIVEFPVTKKLSLSKVQKTLDALGEEGKWVVVGQCTIRKGRREVLIYTLMREYNPQPAGI